MTAPGVYCAQLRCDLTVVFTMALRQFSRNITAPMTTCILYREDSLDSRVSAAGGLQPLRNVFWTHSPPHLRLARPRNGSGADVFDLSAAGNAIRRTKDTRRCHSRTGLGRAHRYWDWCVSRLSSCPTRRIAPAFSLRMLVRQFTLHGVHAHVLGARVDGVRVVPTHPDARSDVTSSEAEGAQAESVWYVKACRRRKIVYTRVQSLCGAMHVARFESSNEQDCEDPFLQQAPTSCTT